jgi:hypothetical protein
MHAQPIKALFDSLLNQCEFSEGELAKFLKTSELRVSRWVHASEAVRRSEISQQQYLSLTRLHDRMCATCKSA